MKYPQKWQARAICPDGASEWFPAEVPGNVQYDYGQMMGWGDINVAENVTQFRQTEDYSWEYRTTLNYVLQPGERAVFVAEGIDYIYDIFLEDKRVLSHEGMFTRVEIDLTDHIGSVLTVLIHPHPKRADAKVEDRSQADQSVKPPVCYGWDWHPRMLVSGIWQDAYVETRSPGWIRRCEPYYTLNEDFTRAQVRFEVDCDEPVEITLFDPDGKPIGTGETFLIHQPRLWWCNGQGLPELYAYEAKTGSHTVSGHFGLRTVRLVMNEGGWEERLNRGRNVVPIQLELNGRKVFAKGSNWVNPDIFNGRIDEMRYKALIALARDAHMNIFRCWGGSGINKRAFYDLCDRMGIMLWVEFPLACNNYEGTPNYLRVLEQEASAIIKDLRAHPSVVMYCGGNELFNSWSQMTDQSLALRLLNKLCYELDMNRPFIMTSPLFGMAHGGYEFCSHYSHEDVFEQFQTLHCTAYTEFGVPSVTDVENLRRIIPKDELFPIRNMGSWRLHHAYDALAPWDWLCWETLERYAPEPLDSLERVVAVSQWLQCEGYKAIFEEARRQAPYCSMAINWCYCEPWITAAGNNLITYPIQPKPAYYAVQTALRPVMPSARIPHFDWKVGDHFKADLWLLNDTSDPAQDIIHASVLLNGAEYPLVRWETGETQGNQEGPTVNWVIPDVDATEFTLQLTADSGASSEYRLRLRRA